MALEDIGLTRGVRTRLATGGVTTLDQLVTQTPRELLDLPGVGPGALAQITDALGRLGLALADDPWAPYTCARHGEASWDTQLQSLFLCDACSADFERLAFGGAEPEYLGPPLDGYCLNCNMLLEVRLRQWFLCGMCDRVVRSIGRSVVSTRYVEAWWRAECQPLLPNMNLRMIDPPVLRARVRDPAAEKVSTVDFIGEENDVPVFGVELKTGRSYVRGRSIGARMGQFQLDHGDCDDILAVVARDRLPVYLFHAQVMDRAEPPTARFEGLGLWWTDLYAMYANYRESKQRPRETKLAAYYNTAMFRNAPEFAAHLVAKGPAELQARLNAEGVPKLYDPPAAGREVPLLPEPEAPDI